MRGGYDRRDSLWVPADRRARYVGRGSTPRFGGGGVLVPPQQPTFPSDFFVADQARLTALGASGTGAGTITDPWSWPYATGSAPGSSAQGDGKLPTTGANVSVRG